MPSPPHEQRAEAIRRKGFWVGLKVTAREKIHGSPTLIDYDEVEKGDVGTIDDIDWADG